MLDISNLLYVINVLFLMSLYFSIIQLLYVYKLLKMTLKLFKNNTKHNFIVCYLIKN